MLVLVLGVVVVGLLTRDGGEATGADATPPAPPARLELTLADGATEVRPDEPVRVEVADGALTAVTLTGGPEGAAVEGELSADASAWTSTGSLLPGSTYELTVEAEGDDGTAVTDEVSFTTLAAARELKAGVMPLDGETVGVGMPVAIFFNEPVTDRAAVEERLEVETSTPVEGAWSWFGDREVRYRPKEYWPAQTDVTLRARIGGVDAGEGVWGAADRTVNFRIGDATVSVVDAGAHQMRTTVNGAVAREMPISAGKPGFETRNGVYWTSERQRDMVMDSSTVGIPVDQGGYQTAVEYAVRMSNSGTFVHAAPWSVGSQGSANVSHGCINVSTENAAWFYGNNKRGDVVEVVNSGAPADPAIEGMREWNRSWEEWREGSALA